MIAARDSLLGRLRRSVLGAWLAAAYALAVLAVSLAPMPTAQAFGLDQGAVLCSGAPVPSSDNSGAPSPPLGELGHCKGCAHHPVLAVPPVAEAVQLVQASALAVLQPRTAESLPRGPVRGLPRSRAPPVV